MNNKDRYIWKTRRRRRRILSYDAKDIKCINEFMYQGLENSIQLELGTLQQDVKQLITLTNDVTVTIYVNIN